MQMCDSDSRVVCIVALTANPRTRNHLPALPELADVSQNKMYGWKACCARIPWYLRFLTCWLASMPAMSIYNSMWSYLASFLATSRNQKSSFVRISGLGGDILTPDIHEPPFTSRSQTRSRISCFTFPNRKPDPRNRKVLRCMPVPTSVLAEVSFWKCAPMDAFEDALLLS